MSSVFHGRAVMAAGLTVVLMSSLVWAQQRQPQGQALGTSPQAGMAAASHADGQLAACLAVDNRNEVALAQFAQQRTQNDEVKQFAKMLADDHGQLLTKLQQFTGAAGGARQAQPQQQQPQQPQQQQQPQQLQPPADRPAAPPEAAQRGQPENISARQPQQQRPAAGQGAARPQRGAIDFVALKEEVGAQCLQTARRELEQKNGAEFDTCYLTMQIGAHLQAIDHMEVFKRHASPSLQAVLDEGVQTAQAHLDKAKELAKSLKQDGAARTTQRESSERRSQ